MALTDNLISYWKLEEASGNAIDALGTNTLTDTGGISRIGGKIGKCISNNGTNNIFLRNTGNLGFGGSGDFSWSQWIYVNAFASKYYMDHASGAGRRCIIYDTGSGMQGYFSGNTINFSGVTTGTWNHYAITVASGTVTAYLNGVSQGTTTFGGAANTTTGYNLGGPYDGTTTQMNGRIDEPAIWSRALSEAEVKQIYNSGVGLPHPFTGALFAIWNKADKEANVTLSNGDLTATSGTTLWRNVRATIGKSTGKWYWEIKTTGGTIETMAAIGTSAATLGGSGATFPGSDAVSYGYYGNGGSKYNNNTGSAYGASFTTNDVIGVALDMDAGTLTFYKNGTSQGQAYSGISGIFFPFLGLDASGQAVVANFGATPFDYPVPTGFNKGVYSGAYENTVMLNTGLLSYYKLDEASGNAADSVGSNTLTNNGTITYGAGKIANSADFGTANTTKYFSSGTAIVDTSTSGVSTVAGWVNINTSPASGVDYELFGAIKSGGRQFEYKYSNISGTLCLNLTVYDGGTAGVYQRNITLTVGTWYLVAFVVRGNTINIFVDGLQVGTIQTITNVSNGSAANNFTLGRHPNASAGFSCSKADETGVWGRALSAIELDTLYNAGTGLTHPFNIVVSSFKPKIIMFE